jgi:Domain of unknown function (DUF4386)
MDTDRRSAVLTGVFLLLGTVVGVIGLGVVLEPLNSATDYLTVYGESETRVLVASLLQLCMGVALVGMSIAVYPVLRKFSASAAIAYIGARLLEGVVFIIGVLSMLALAGLGRDYIAAGSPSDSYFQVAGGLLLAVPEWAGHVILDVAIFPLGAVVLYTVFYRVGLVPRWLSVWASSAQSSIGWPASWSCLTSSHLWRACTSCCKLRWGCRRWSWRSGS